MTLSEFLFPEEKRPLGPGSADAMVQKEIGRLHLSCATEDRDEEATYDGVLANNFGLRDKETVTSLSATCASWRMTELFRGKAVVPFEFATLEDIHGALYGDIYPSAGMVRTTEIAPYCMASFIEKEGERIVSGIQATKYLKLAGKEETASFLAHFLSDLSALHPFHQGNAEAFLCFSVRIGSYAGFSFDWDRTDKVTLLSRMERAVSGDIQPLLFSMRSMVQREST